MPRGREKVSVPATGAEPKPVCKRWLKSYFGVRDESVKMAP